MGPLMMLMTAAPAVLAAVGATLFVAFGYLLLTIDRTRASSISKDDTQAGIKLVLHALIIAGVTIGTLGLFTLLSYVLGGFKGGSAPIKASLPSIIVGIVVVFFVAKVLLGRTNNSTQPQVERYALGYLGLQFGIAALFALDLLLAGLFNDAPWQDNSMALAGVIISAAGAGFTVPRFGALSGWTVPVRPVAPPPPQFPPQGGYGGPPPGGYGGPPQGGGYPPQGGSGGYPPQGGGGYPPQGGGGYPPQGGYGR